MGRGAVMSSLGAAASLWESQRTSSQRTSRPGMSSGAGAGGGSSAAYSAQQLGHFVT
jgi:hypothetical protein